MFTNLKIKRLNKKIKQNCDAMDYSSAYINALALLGVMGNKQLDNNALRTVLERAGMESKHLEYYVAQHRCSLMDSEFKDFVHYQETKKALNPEDTYELDREIIDVQLDDELITQDRADILYGELELKHFAEVYPHIQQPELVEAEKLRIRKDILKSRFRDEEIGYLDYQKSLATLNNEKWINYEIKIDPEVDKPNAFEIQFDYNQEFTKWLKMNGVTLTPQEEESLEEDETYEDKLTEKWVKSSLISLAAGMLQDDGGETFRSVVASEPEAQIVENLEIDQEQLDEMRENLSEEEFNKVIEFSKQRRMYR